MNYVGIGRAGKILATVKKSQVFDFYNIAWQ